MTHHCICVGSMRGASRLHYCRRSENDEKCKGAKETRVQVRLQCSASSSLQNIVTSKKHAPHRPVSGTMPRLQARYRRQNKAHRGATAHCRGTDALAVSETVGHVGAVATTALQILLVGRQAAQSNSPQRTFPSSSSNLSPPRSQSACRPLRRSLRRS